MNKNEHTLSERERFLNSFRGEVRSNIVEFGKFLWECESDVFIFMARKAACFFDCLRALKIADVRGLAVSDRILESDLAFLKGKTVTLVDDCVFSGTSLYHAKQKVEAAGCKSCNTVTLSINKDWMRPALLPGNAETGSLNFIGPMSFLSDAQCVQQCFDIVRAISIYARPYDVDYPHTEQEKLTSKAFDKIIHASGWQAYDISSSFQKVNNVRAFTLIPERHFLGTLLGKYNGLQSLIQAAKIRIYARENEKNSWSVRFVPIVMLGAMDKASLSDVSPLVTPELQKCFLSLGLKEERARYRFLTFLISWVILNEFKKELFRSAGLQLSKNIRIDLAELVFGPQFQIVADSGLKSLEKVSFPASVEEPDAEEIAGFGKDTVKAETAQELIYESSKPFTWLYENLELKARKIVYEEGLQASSKKLNRNLKRLRKGFSPRRLMSRIKSDSYDVPRFISLLLDRLVDLGVAVPIVVEDNSLIYRAFRHGEDAVFGEAEERLTIKALKAYMNQRNISEIFGLELQKFIVLFVQISVRGGELLERLNTSDSVNVGSRIVSIKGHLHGPVPMIATLDQTGKVGVPYVDGLDYPAEWLVENWVKRGLLSEEKGKRTRKYTIVEEPGWNIGRRKEAEARNIGRCLGSLIGGKSSNKPINNDTDLVLFSTCAEAENQLRALSGEISILVQRWRNTIIRVKPHVQNGQYIEAKRLLHSINSLFIAINSGAMKYNWFVNGSFKSKLEEVRSNALKIDPSGALSDQWDMLWPENLSIGKDSTSSAMWSTIRSMGQWLVSTNVAIRLYSYFLVRIGLESGEGDEQEALDSFEDCAKWCELFSELCPKHLTSEFGQIIKKFESGGKKMKTEVLKDDCRSMLSFIGGAGCSAMRQLLSDASLLSDAYSTTGDFRPFPYAVYFEIENIYSDEQSVHFEYMKLLDGLVGESHRILPDNHNPWKAGTWVLIRGNRRSTIASDFCRALVDRALNTKINFRCVVFGQLSYDDSVRDMSGSVKMAFGDFFRRVSNLKESVLPDSYDNQLVFVNEMVNGLISDAVKFCRQDQNVISKERIISSLDDELLEKAYRVAEIVCSTQAIGPQENDDNLKVQVDVKPHPELRRDEKAGLSILIIATEWDSRHGGLSTFNRELCKSLATSGASVICYVPECDEIEASDAKTHGVILLEAAKIAGRSGVGVLSQKPNLPRGFVPQVVIGHDRITGSESIVVGNIFPKAKRVLFIHTAPEEIEWHKEERTDSTGAGRAAGRKAEQVGLAQNADLVVAVGPHLTSEFRTDLRGLDKSIEVLNLLPGLEQKNSIHDDLPESIRCLVMGRLEDYNLKGVGFAAKALGLAISRMGDEGLRVKMVIRGIPEGDDKEIIKRIKTDSGLANLKIVARHFTAKETDILKDFREASLVLMPSKAEGFGLVALEAIGAGVPTLISKESGLSDTMMELVPSVAKEWILPVSDDSINQWAERIYFLLSSRRGAFDRAKQLRLLLDSKLEWNKSARILLGKLDEIVDTGSTKQLNLNLD